MSVENRPGDEHIHSSSLATDQVDITPSNIPEPPQQHNRFLDIFKKLGKSDRSTDQATLPKTDTLQENSSEVLTQGVQQKIQGRMRTYTSLGDDILSDMSERYTTTPENDTDLVLNTTNIMDASLSRRTLLKGAMGLAGSVALGKISQENEVSAQSDNTETVSERSLLNFTPETLPQNTKELIPGNVWFGELTSGMRDALDRRLQEYREAGVPDLLAMGLPETYVSFFVRTRNDRTGENNIREIALGERGAYHFADANEDGQPELYRLLGARGIADGKFQLDAKGEEFHYLSPQSANIISNTPITGEPGSQVPSFSAMRRSLTIHNDNHAENQVGQYALNEMTKDGNSNYFPNNSIESMIPLLNSEHASEDQIREALRIAKYEAITGHNVTEGFDRFMKEQAGTKALEIYGFPISEPYLVHSVVNGESTPLVMQVFERGTVTYNPSNRSEHQYQGGLIGNFLNSVISGREHPVRVNSEIEPEIELIRHEGNGWSIEVHPEASFTINPTNIAELNKIGDIIGSDRKIVIQLTKDIDDAVERYGLDRSKFNIIRVQDETGKIHDIGSNFGRTGGIIQGPYTAAYNRREDIEEFPDREIILKSNVLAAAIGQMLGDNTSATQNLYNEVAPQIYLNTSFSWL